jgi:hypothetical protein
VDLVMAASKEMSQLMGEQDRQQRNGEGKPAGQREGMAINQSESVYEFIERDRFVVSIGDGELGTRD